MRPRKRVRKATMRHAPRGPGPYLEEARRRIGMGAGGLEVEAERERAPLPTFLNFRFGRSVVRLIQSRKAGDASSTRYARISGSS